MLDPKKISHTMTSMKEGNDYGSIPISTAKTLIELDTFDVSGINIYFITLMMDQDHHAMGFNQSEESNHYDGTDESVAMINQITLKYLVNEGILDMWNKL